MSNRSARQIPTPPVKPDVCRLYCFNESLVSRLRDVLPDAIALGRATDFFGALASSTRLSIVHCLSQANELCVCDIANALRMNLSTVSHQLRYLRSAGFVTFRNEGKMAFYRLADRRIAEAIGVECGQIGWAPTATERGAP